MRMFTLALALLGALAISTREASALDKENTLYIDLDWGRVVIEMRPDLAPKHVAQIKTHARAKIYDNVPFHRVIDGFMAQTGDPDGTGAGGAGDRLPAEFNNEPHKRGIVSMARTQDPNSARSQFFIVLADSNFLDRQYTVWGNVESGMEHIDALPKGEPPREPGKIVKATVG